MINRGKLVGLMAELGVTQKNLAEHLKCSENTLSGKITGKGDFRISEAVEICEFLKIADPLTRAAIFLPDSPKSGTNDVDKALSRYGKEGGSDVIKVPVCNAQKGRGREDRRF